jgi:hypothetical protein
MTDGSQFHAGGRYLNNPLNGYTGPYVSTNIPSAFGPIDAQFLGNVTQLSGTGADALAAVPTATLSTPYQVLLFIGGYSQTWILQASTAATAAGYQRPNDFNLVTNPKVWEQTT